ncbi:MAG: hypothetical protein JXQ73_11485 [Phycisphaerae bacterium]|nr:hypothetical protein [Phycisphaerae bacterium]
MTIQESVLAHLKSLPVDQQVKVLDYVEQLPGPNVRREPFKDLRGAFAQLDVDLSPEDFQQVRREMWRSFPRDIEP